MATQDDRHDDFRLKVPLDASGLGELPDDERQDLKVVGVAAGGEMVSAEVTLDPSCQATATLAFAERPEAITVYVGPAAATDEELVATQTLRVNVHGPELAGTDRLKLDPVRISPYFWYWWLRWCREFVIRGRVVCPDGNAVPGAEVCAYDVDWWFLWNSSQQVGCATTDEHGAFEIRFRWCCGWWPWWWWRHRVWRFEPQLAERVGAVLGDDLGARLGTIASAPSLATLAALMPEGSAPMATLQQADPGELEQLRRGLLAELPASAELAGLHVWPWWPWWPWWDCTPDIIFKVTQECDGQSKLVVDEGLFDTRWNIPTNLSVVLVAADACCAPPGCEEDCTCLLVDGVCGRPLSSVGGNLGAPPVPAGYYRPGAVAPGTAAWDGDQPFGGTVTLTKNPGDLAGVDFYEIERWTGAAWVALPPGAELAFQRQYWEPSGSPQMHYPTFSVLTMSGHKVYETRAHRQAALGGAWFPSGGWTRMWLSHNYSTLAVLDTSTFPDGSHEFRVVGWQDGGGGTLKNKQVLPVCGLDDENRFVLTFDNRTVTAVGHDPAHNCGPVHVCTVEPDTHILDVRISGVSIDPCDVAKAEGPLEIDFSVTDPGGHLARYDLVARYGLSGARPLLPLGTLTPLGAAPVGPTYGQAIAAVPNQGAVAPHWYGGTYRLTIANAQEAFQEPCCYLIELTAWKRTIVNCDGGFPHRNRTEYSVGIGIC